MNKTVTLTINGKILRFNVTPEVYNKYIDEIQSTKKVGPTRNALMRTVHAEDSAAERAAIMKQVKPRPRPKQEEVVDDETRSRIAGRLNRPL